MSSALLGWKLEHGRGSIFDYCSPPHTWGATCSVVHQKYWSILKSAGFSIASAFLNAVYGIQSNGFLFWLWKPVGKQALYSIQECLFCHCHCPSWYLLHLCPNKIVSDQRREVRSISGRWWTLEICLSVYTDLRNWNLIKTWMQYLAFFITTMLLLDLVNSG